MTRTNNQTKTTTLVADCPCVPKPTKGGKPWQTVGNSPKTKAPTQQPKALFMRYDFHNLPGVALIVPEGMTPIELIRISAAVAEEMSLLAMRDTVQALLAPDEEGALLAPKIGGLIRKGQQ